MLSCWNSWLEAVGAKPVPGAKCYLTAFSTNIMWKWDPERQLRPQAHGRHKVAQAESSQDMVAMLSPQQLPGNGLPSPVSNCFKVI